MSKWIAAGILAMFAFGCSQGAAPHQELTEAQRDSVLARSRLAGAGGVGRAMQASGEEASHAADLNAAVDSLPR
jgi:hypothetical protein